MLLAWGVLILSHWAQGTPNAVTVKQIVEMTVAILLIAFLDSNANTEPVGKGLAILFLVAVLLSKNGTMLLGALTKLTSATPPPVKKVK
jgi:hypothetical protein